MPCWRSPRVHVCWPHLDPSKDPAGSGGSHICNAGGSTRATREGGLDAPMRHCGAGLLRPWTPSLAGRCGYHFLQEYHVEREGGDSGVCGQASGGHEVLRRQDLGVARCHDPRGGTHLGILCDRRWWPHGSACTRIHRHAC
jgi:hypothetical protein